jgi:class 3 adenylate cyclase
MQPSEAALLVVDDNEDNRYTLTRRLKRLGYTNFTTAECGREALELIEKQDFDVVLLDVMMPEMNGYEVLEHLNQQGKLADLPVIMISALTEMDSIVRCIELGAEDYLPKPFNVTMLKARIGASLEKKSLRDAVARQLELIREVFGKYVPEDVAAAVLEGKGEFKPIKTTATILYTDIASFTEIAEERSPEQVMDMLNEYFPAVIEPIEHYGGVVNQFQGDAMLVTFNVPVEDPDHAEKAIKTAKEIQDICAGQQFSGVSLTTRIGITTGPVIAGNVGSGRRFNYTVHGDAVNLAARLEQLNKQHGTKVLISDNTVKLVDGSYPLESVGTISIRGKAEPVTVYKLNC